MEEWEEDEGQRYDWLYNNGYTSGGPGWPLGWATKATGINFKDRHLRVLDVGCGLGTLAHMYDEYVGIDVSSVVIEKASVRKRGEFIVAGITDIDRILSGRNFDLVLCLDVLEHIGMEYLRTAIDCISKIKTTWVLMSICCRAAVFKDKDGVRVHKSVMPQTEWEALLSSALPSVVFSEQNRQKTFVAVAKLR